MNLNSYFRHALMLNLVILHYNEAVYGLIKDESLIYTFFAKERIV